MTSALADLRELKDLSVRFGVELISSLTGVMEGCTPLLLGEVCNASAVGTNHAVARFKLAEHLHRCLMALRAWNSDLHIAHGDDPPADLIEVGVAALLNWVPEEVFDERAIRPDKLVEMLFQVLSQRGLIEIRH